MSFTLKKTTAVMLAALAITRVVHASEQAPDIHVIAVKPQFHQLVAINAQAELITDSAVWAEGPACLPQGQFIFSDVKQNRVMSWSKEQGVKTWLSPSDYQNGHAVDAEGRVIAASHGKRALLRQEKDGHWVTLADSWQGKRLNSPNDVTVASDGAIWFTDPTFGVLNKEESYGGTPELDGEYVFRYDVHSKTLSKINTPEVHSPNGLAFSPDGKTLYVSDTQQAHDFNNSSLAHRIIAYRITGGKAEAGRVFADISPGLPDGIAVDKKGNVWSSSKEGVQVFSPAGEQLGKITIPAEVTGNLALCTDASKHKWLYVTASNMALRLPVLVSNASQMSVEKDR